MAREERKIERGGEKRKERSPDRERRGKGNMQESRKAGGNSRVERRKRREKKRESLKGR